MLLQTSLGLYGKYKVELIEPDEKRSSVVIEGLPSDAIVIKVDGFPPLNDVFKGADGECSRCDFLIFSESQQCIIFIEMKTSSEKEHHLIKQLRGGLRFLRYIQLIFDYHKGVPDFAKEYKLRFVSLLHTDTTLNKRPTRQAPQILHDTPENMWKLTVGNKAVRYQQIAAVSR